MNKELINQLENIVKTYYPPNIGNTPDLALPIPDRATIVAGKINAIIAKEPTVWSQLIAAVENTYAFPVKDISYLQTPNYKLEIILNKWQYAEHISCTRSLTLLVSLLCPYYTLYFEDNYTISNVKRDSSSRDVPLKVVFSQIMPDLFENAGGYIYDLKNIVGKYFPQYICLFHKFLMQRTVDGKYDLPWAIDEGPHPLFFYLFDGPFDKNMEILD